MKRIISVIAIMMITIPTVADVLPTPATCNENTLQSTGDTPVSLRAEWTANTINLEYYSDNTQLNNIPATSQTCEYGGGITLPDEPSKTGYSFMGWRLKPLFDMTTLEDAEPSDSWLSRSFPTEYNSGNPVCREGKSDGDCDDTKFSHLSDGEWSVSFGADGTIKGESVCATNSGTWGTAGTPIGTDGQYCWCRASGHAESGSTNYQDVASPAWVFLYGDAGYAGYCASDCAIYCADNVNDDSAFRRAVFGVAGD